MLFMGCGHGMGRVRMRVRWKVRVRVRLGRCWYNRVRVEVRIRG
jgi:hypothetical protein